MSEKTQSYSASCPPRGDSAAPTIAAECRVPLLSKDDIDFIKARPVISAAQKFIIPVAAFGDADPLVYPPGDERSGLPITDYEGRPVGEKGIIFLNKIDRCYQAVPADGRSVIVINEVTSEQARAIEGFV